MYFRWLVVMLLLLMSWAANAQELAQVYCPQNHLTITLGMSPEQVIAACGQPLSKQDSDQPVLRKIPMTQLIFNNLGTQEPFEMMGFDLKAGSGGVTLEVDVIKNKVQGIRLDSNSENTFSICGANIHIGDPASIVYYNCGSPSMVNNTFITEEVQTTEKPQIWIYQPSLNQPNVTLTFIEGKLQSINQ